MGSIIGNEMTLARSSEGNGAAVETDLRAEMAWQDARFEAIQKPGLFTGAPPKVPGLGKAAV